MSGWAALAGARDLGVPVLQTYHALGTVKKRHQGAADTSPPDRVEIETAVGRECSRMIATCEDEVSELEAMGLSRRHISVVPCGVDPVQFAPVPATRRPASAPRRLLAVGRLVPRKGFDRAIRALAEVPDAELLIAGGPEAALLPAEPEAERLRAIADECGVADRVTLLGGVSRELMPGLMSSADLVLSLPRYEPFGIVPVEAMACCAPVLATAVGGQLDTVVDGVTGVLVPADDDHDIGAVIRRLLADPERLARYGAAGRRHVLARYTWDRVAEGVTRAYSAVSCVPAPSLSGVLR
jgi:glycosyltransferase involved in cell wall biosynthesis